MLLVILLNMSRFLDDIIPCNLGNSWEISTMCHFEKLKDGAVGNTNVKILSGKGFQVSSHLKGLFKNCAFFF